MRQASKMGKSPSPKKKKTTKPRIKRKCKANHPQYGTSKLEEYFAHEFLEKLGIDYIYQFEAKDIKRWYDFYIPSANLLIEVDGDYYHSNPLLYEGKELNRMQKKNKYVDVVKNKWAAMHCIPLLRIWENDIRNNPESVIKKLQERIGICTEKVQLKERKKKRGLPKKEIINEDK